MDGDLLIGDDNALNHQAQDPLLELEGGLDQLSTEALTEGRDHILQPSRLLRLSQLGCQQLHSVFRLLAGVAETLPTLLQLGQLEYPNLVRINQALLFPLKRRSVALQPLELPLGIRELRPLPALLLPDVLPDEFRLLQQLRDMLPHHRFDVRLADAPQVTASLRRLNGTTPGTFIAPTGGTCMPP